MCLLILTVGNDISTGNFTLQTILSASSIPIVITVIVSSIVTAIVTLIIIALVQLASRKHHQSSALTSRLIKETAAVNEEATVWKQDSVRKHQQKDDHAMQEQRRNYVQKLKHSRAKQQQKQKHAPVQECEDVPKKDGHVQEEDGHVYTIFLMT